MLTGRSADSLAQATKEIADAGYQVAYCVADPTSPEDNERLVAETVAAFGGVDILVAAAGTNKPAPITEQPVDDWQAVMDANLKGPYLLCKAAGRVMIAQGRGGKVILVSSARSTLGMANYSAYCPSKGAIDSLTQALACEWGKHRINVNAIAPTVFRTALTQWMFDDQETYKKFLVRIPLGRLGEPEDFYGAILFLASSASNFMTGAVMHLDGGYTAG
jgi:NAD(P)-dependent dehydrogenase (short-subunit alcohol dehydrogenase family)